jgi:hypothetical protein
MTKKPTTAPKKATKKAPFTPSKTAQVTKTPPAKDAGKSKATPAKKGPGVIATMVELLQGASAKAPLSKADLIAKLEKAFPDRPNVSKTVSCQLGKRIEKEQGIKLHKNDDGYWAAK